MASSTSLRNAALRARSMLGPESEVPPWLVAFERFGVEHLTKGKAPKQLEFANDRLYQAYFDKHPEYRQHPLDLNSDNPSPMKLFVLTQAALMEKGYGRKAAYSIVEAEFNKAMGGASLTASQTALVAAQKREEAVLLNAVEERREQFGPPANLYSEPVSPAFNFRLPPRHSQQSAPAPSSLPQASQFQTSGLLPRARPTGDIPSSQENVQQGSQGRGQAEEQGAKRSTHRMPRGQVSYQAQKGAPAGFVQFKSKGPQE